jgi:hypothetical protein
MSTISRTPNHEEADMDAKPIEGEIYPSHESESVVVRIVNSRRVSLI